MQKVLLRVAFGSVLALSTSIAGAQIADCKDVLNAINALNTLGGAPGAAKYKSVHDALTAALNLAVGDNGGLDFEMWGSIVDRDGRVCAVTFSGNDRGDQWPGSRVISMQKANTANAFSLPGLALSTANLYTAVQPGNSLFGLQHSNPVDTAVAYGNPSHAGKNDGRNYGTQNDPATGRMTGGVNVFGGGLAIYSDSLILGGLGVSGDTSCADHNVAWRTRESLGLGTAAAAFPGGVNGPAPGNDGIIYGASNAFAHPFCGGNEDEIAAGIGASDGTAAP